MSKLLKNPRAWWIVLTVISGLAFAAWAVRTPYPSEFTIRLTATAIKFTTAEAEENAGLFNDQNTSLDLTVESTKGFDIRDDQGVSIIPKHGYSNTLKEVRLKSTDMSAQLEVTLRTFDKALRMGLRRVGSVKKPMAKIEATCKTVSFDACGEGKKSFVNEWSIFVPNNHVVFTLRPLDISKRKGIRPERGIDLAPGSEVTFATDILKKDSTILESQNGLQLTDVNRTIPLTEGQRLELRNLSHAILQRIGPAPERQKEVRQESSIFETESSQTQEGMEIWLRGTSNDIEVDGKNKAETYGEYIGTRIFVLEFVAFVTALGGVISFMSQFLPGLKPKAP